MNFYQLLVIFSVILFALSSAILFLYKREDKKQLYALPDFRLYYILFIVILVLSGYYSLIGERSALWFIAFTAYVLLTLFYGVTVKTSSRNFASVSLILLSIVASTIPILQNNGIIFGADQWRDLQVTSFIVREGTFTGSLQSGYYSFIPLFNLINAVLTTVTGWQPMASFIIMQILYTSIIVLSIYVVVGQLFKSREASFLALLIFLSTPRLSTIQAIPAAGSIVFGVFLLFIMLEFKPSLVYLMPVASFTTTVLHPIGVIPLLAVAAALIILSYVFIKYRLNPQHESYISIFFIICLLVTIVYWSIDTRVLTGIFNPFRRLIGILTSFEYAPSVYSPQYLESEFLIFAYPWALPVALTGVYLLYYFLKERRGNQSSSNISTSITLVAALVAVFLIIVTFISILLSPGASLERYINVPAYTLMLFPSAIVLRKIIQTKNNVALLVVLIMLSVNVYLGASSPNWAPFENPTYGAYRSTYRGYLEANTLADKMAKGTRVYEDNDLSIIEVANLQGYELTKDTSYQTIRKVINDFKFNTVEYIPRIINSLVYLRIKEVQDQELLMGPIDVLYNSGTYSGLRISELLT